MSLLTLSAEARGGDTLENLNTNPQISQQNKPHKP